MQNGDGRRLNPNFPTMYDTQSARSKVKSRYEYDEKLDPGFEVAAHHKGQQRMLIKLCCGFGGTLFPNFLV